MSAISYSKQSGPLLPHVQQQQENYFICWVDGCQEQGIDVCKVCKFDLCQNHLQLTTHTCAELLEDEDEDEYEEKEHRPRDKLSGAPAVHCDVDGCTERGTRYCRRCEVLKCRKHVKPDQHTCSKSMVEYIQHINQDDLAAVKRKHMYKPNLSRD